MAAINPFSNKPLVESGQGGYAAGLPFLSQEQQASNRTIAMKKILDFDAISQAVSAAMYAEKPNIYVETPREAKGQCWIHIMDHSFLGGTEIERITKSICKPFYTISVCARMAPVDGFFHEPYIAVVCATNCLKEEFYI